MAGTLDSVVKILTDSGIVALGNLEKFIPPKAHPTSVDDLVAELVKNGHLTKFQATQIAAGKAKSLILGGYTVVDRIGAGGMGQVFKAVHRRMDRIVAIKLLPPKMTKDPMALARFEREARAAAKLNHSNIVTAYDADQANGAHFLVMEFVDGKDLSVIVKKNGPFSVEQAIAFILQAAQGLEYAHKRGVIHRDIKPANMLLDSDGTVKILDMGLARLEADGNVAAQAELTGTGAVMGTVDYMAPEQGMSTKHADARADIYSLGCSLYYLIVGKAVYEGETVAARLLAHHTHPIPDLRKDCPAVPEQLDAIFKKMVAKQLEDRYQTMTEVIADLDRLCGNPATDGAALSTGSALRSATVVTPNRRKDPQLTTKLATPTVRVKRGESLSKNAKAVVGAGVAVVVVLLGVMIFIFGSGNPEIAEVPAPDVPKPADTAGDPNPPASTGSSPTTDATPTTSPPTSTQASQPEPIAVSASPPSGPTNYALEFRAGSRVTVGSLHLDKAGPLTMEARVEVPARMSTRGGGIMGYTFNELLVRDGLFSFAWQDANKSGVTVKSAGIPVSGGGHEVAGVVDGTKIRLFIDGKLVGEKDLLQPPSGQHSGSLLIGRDFAGLIDEIRISKVARYKADYKPVGRFDSDKDTLALYHCDEGTGSSLRDDSGNGYHGTLSSVTWVPPPTLASAGTPNAAATPPATGAVANPSTWKWSQPENVGSINSDKDDSPSSFSPDDLTMYFASNRSGSRGGMDMWVATRPSRDAPWGEPKNLSINSIGDDAHPRISADGLTLWFTSDRPGGLGTRDIWIATRGSLGSDWNQPFNIGPHVNSIALDEAPRVTADGRTLYFQSKRPGGLGNTDFWMCTRPSATGVWGPPSNLGPPVNTNEFQYDPFTTPDGLTLLYSTLRMGESGEFDLYASVRPSVDAAWGKPVNLGPSINGPKREYAPVLSSDGSTLYWLSLRDKGRGGADIWSARRLDVPATTSAAGAGQP